MAANKLLTPGESHHCQADVASGVISLWWSPYSIMTSCMECEGQALQGVVNDGEAHFY